MVDSLDIAGLYGSLARESVRSMKGLKNQEMILNSFLIQTPDRIDKYLKEEEVKDRGLFEYYSQFLRYSFTQVQFNKLSQGFIHDDLHDQNLIVLQKGKIGVIDFGDLNYNYTIQELATISSDFFYKFREKHPSLNSPSMIEQAIEESMEQMIKHFYGEEKMNREELKILFPAMAAKSINAYLEYEERKEDLINVQYVAQDGEPMLEKIRFFKEFEFPRVISKVVQNIVKEN